MPRFFTCLTLILLWLPAPDLVAQSVVRIDSLPQQGVLLDKGWKYQSGDNPEWAKPGLDDSRWESIDPTKDIFELPQVPKTGQIGWLRICLSLDSTVLQNQLALIIQQSIASEYYLNGKLIKRFGKISPNPNEIEAFDPLWKPVSFPANKESNQTVAVRFVLKPAIHYTKIFETSNPIATIQLLKSEEAVNIYTNLRAYTERFTMTQLGVWVMLFVLNFIFFLPNSKNRSRLYFAVFALLFLIGDVIQLNLYILETDVANKFYIGNLVFVFYVFAEFSLMAAIYAVFERKRDLVFWLVAGYIIPALLLDSLVYGWGWQFGGPMLEIFVHLNIIRIAIIATLKKKRNAYIIAVGAIASLFFFVLFLRMGTFYNDLFLLSLTNLRITYYFLFIYCIPISAFVYLGLDFAFINKVLNQKLIENETLSTEKQQILATQNEVLEAQVTERTAELEEKNRDLEIEAALDRIRASSLAMHHSDEIESVVAVLFEKLKDLGLAFDGGAAIHIFSEGSKDAAIWVVSPQQPPTKINLPYNKEAFVDNPIILDVWHAKETGNSIFNKFYSFDEKNRYFNYVFTHNDHTKIPDMGRDFILNAPNYTASFIAEKNSLLGANSWTGQLFSETDFELLKRVARVFEQAYTRFLDLQKAEAQAREAQIEVALERVRSKTMSMQKSNELAGAISVLCKEVLSLGIDSKDMETCYITTFDDSGPIGEIYLTTSNGDLIPNSFRARYDEDYYFRQLFAAWKNGDSFFILHAEGDELKKHFAFLYSSVVSSSSILEMRAEDHAQFPSETLTHVLYFSQGYLAVVTRKPVPEYHEVFKRFGGTLQQAYTRFLDLQKAEAQAREAQISTALERIRNRTLLMRDSAELSEAAVTLFEEFKSIGLLAATDQTYFCTIDERTKSAQVWITQKDGKAGLSSFDMPLTTFLPLTKVYEGWKQQKPLVFRDLVGEELTEYLHLLASLQTLKTDEEYQQVFVAPPERRVIVDATYKFGTVGIVSDKPFLQETIDTLVRFAKVFDFTYTRFLDLQKAEAQAREAQVEVALERVRSRTIAMQKSEELREVVATIYEQLQNLGFTYGALGIVIMDETSGDMDWWMAGFGKEKYPENYYIPYFDHPFYLAQLNAWKEEKKFVILEVAGQQKKRYDEVIFSKSDFVRIPVEAQKIMLGFEKITFSNANMKHGALSWGTEPINDDHAKILQRFAVVFEQTYTRFLDLKLAEELAQQAQLDLENLKVEKRRTEEALKELKATQVQLIQKEKMASLGELMAGIAHEIQNPLNFVNNFSEVSTELVTELEEEQQKPDRDSELEAELLGDLKQNLQKISHHGHRASSIVKGMLEHSRTSTGKRQSTDLNALADEYLRLAYQGLRAKDKTFNCELVTDFSPNLGKVEVVPPEIGRVLLNLFNNAFYAVHEKQKTAPADCQPTVTVSTRKIDKQVEIWVKDNGTGMPELVKDKIFQPFFTTKPTGEGTGLGLSLSYDIITKGHSGTLTVESVEGEGTVFIIELPA